MPLSKGSRISFAIAISFALVGCAEAQLLSSPGAASVAGDLAKLSSPIVSGLVASGGDFVGATATLYGADGKAIAKAPLEGNVYQIPVASVPASYRVTVTGGTLNGQPFTAELRAEHRPESKVQTGPTVDWVSTLASRSLDANKGQSLQDAFKAVKAYFDIPDAAEAESTRELASYFNGAAFLAAAGANIGAALDQGAAGVAGGQKQAYLPSGTDRFLPALGIAVAKFVGENIASSLVGSGTDAGLNFVLSALGLGGDDAAAAANKKLDKLQADVEQLKNQVDAVAASVQTTSAFSDYNNTLNIKLGLQITQLQTLDNLHDQLAELLRIKASRTAINNTQAEILEREKAYFVSATETVTTWEQGVKAVLPFYSNYVIARNANLITPEMSRDIFTQWQYLDGLQAKMMAYLTGYQTANKVDNANIMLTLKQWQTARVNEMALVRGVPQSLATDTLGATKFNVANVTTTLASVPDNGIVDRLNKTVWRKDIVSNVVWSSLDKATQDNAVNGWKVASFQDHVNLHNKGPGGTYRSFASVGMDAKADAANATFWTGDRSADTVFKNLQVGSYSVGPKAGTFTTLQEINSSPGFYANSDLAPFLAKYSSNTGGFGGGFGGFGGMIGGSLNKQLLEGRAFTPAAINIPVNSGAGSKEFPSLREVSPDEVKRRMVRLAYVLTDANRTTFGADTQYDMMPPYPYHMGQVWSTGLYLAMVKNLTDAEAARLPVRSN